MLIKHKCISHTQAKNIILTTVHWSTNAQKVSQLLKWTLLDAQLAARLILEPRQRAMEAHVPQKSSP